MDVEEDDDGNNEGKDGNEVTPPDIPDSGSEEEEDGRTGELSSKVVGIPERRKPPFPSWDITVRRGDSNISY